MKKVFILLIALLIISVACQRSQFSTTTRHTRHGKVIYVNHYQKERSKLHLTGPASSKPANIATKEDMMVRINDLGLLLKKHYGLSTDNSFSDTIKSSVIKKITDDYETPPVIKFRNGHKETIKIISRSCDTLRYHLIDEPDVVRTIKMEQVDTIIPWPENVQDMGQAMKKGQIDTVVPFSEKEKVAVERKTRGPGWFDYLLFLICFDLYGGLLLSVLCVIAGALILSKIKRHHESSSGKGAAIAILVLGIIGIITCSILIF
jgi:hypothetical protein